MHCFSKSKRLLSKSEYDFVFKQAKKLVTSKFIFLYCENVVEHARLGMAISKKVVAKAHDRNRIKRMLRETFRIKELPNVDIVILARKGVANSDKQIIYSHLVKAWDRLSALCKK